MRIAVCGDDAADLKRMNGFVSRFITENLLQAEIECFSEARQMLLQYRKKTYDLLLDIYMNGPSGVEAADALRKAGSGCEIIFVTNSLDHALDGYRLKAMEYLVKPVAWKETEQALLLPLRGLVPLYRDQMQQTNRASPAALDSMGRGVWASMYFSSPLWGASDSNQLG
ncbi:LytR/AlgR family response regulator transcription factor [Candidatus Soleaferrea massiliensis]|uniref:LytR/AlgR family response regulator transcription factor n=1 Tax=Candidatus Soleaferrea massiliensis TaxID=1470354 RepID=UPI00058BFB15|nr:response regulator [Candidatus Soleaferrea massiliensis]